MSKKFLRSLSSWLAVGTMLVSCTAQRIPSAQQTYTPSQEQRLVVYTSHKEEVYWPIIKEFEERTGIWVEVVSGGTNELLDRIARGSDNPAADVMFGGGVESLEFYRDCFAPYPCAEADMIPAQYRSEDDLWTPFSSLPIVLIYNTKLVSPEQVSSWSDLLAPRFQGRIAFTDPSISGSCFTGLITYLYAVGGDGAIALQQLASQLDGKQLLSSADVLATVADGTNLVGITLEETAFQRIAAGEDIAVVYPTDGTSTVPDGSALVKNAVHEDNAKLFLDFIVSWDVQQLLVSQFYRRSVRQDVEPAQTVIPLEQIPLVDYNVEWANQNRDRILMSWAFYLDNEVQP